MTNWNILGHEWAVTALQRDIQQKRVRHAYLIAGPAGIGKRTLAMAFIQALMCEKGTGCGECRACKLILHQNHPDVMIVKPVVSGERIKTEKILVDRIRDELIVPITRKPVEGRYRIGFVPNFEAANENAANAFLKTLEEPPEYAVLILTTDDLESLLPTIRSRCEVVNLRTLPTPLIKEALIERWRTAPEEADLLAHLSGGRMGWAVTALSDAGQLLERRAQRLEELGEVLQGSRTERFAYAATLASDRESLKETLDFWLTWWRDVLLLAANPQAAPLNRDQTLSIKQAADVFGLDTAARAVEAIQKTVAMLPRNVNARLAVEVLMLELPKV
jgi:DNA polymerase-3 subunit delta'